MRTSRYNCVYCKMGNYKLLVFNPGTPHNKNCPVVNGIWYFGHDVSSFEDTVIMHIDDYERVFGRKRNNTKVEQKRLSVVKITYIDRKVKKTIYRKFRPTKNEAIRGKVAVSYHSLLFLKEGDDSIVGKTVDVQKSWCLPFYLNHPNEVVHTSFLLAMLSVILSVVSIIISIC